ncbi:DoxX family protein [Flavihumibacter sp. R14]|nr:DoxX family protein [Flavihumibacter soli]
MGTKTKRIITIVVTVIAVLMVLFSGIMKVAGGQEIIDAYSKLGVGKYLTLLAAMEISFALIFAFPKTMKIGFILLCCYFGGAIATELSHGATLNAITPMVLIWIAAFLRDRSIFLPEAPASGKLKSR